MVRKLQSSVIFTLTTDSTLRFCHWKSEFFKDIAIFEEIFSILQHNLQQETVNIDKIIRNSIESTRNNRSIIIIK